MPFKKFVKYLGVRIDQGLRYTEHVLITSENAAATAASLARLMPNIGGPREYKRRLLDSVVHAKMLYGAEVWASAIERETIRRRLASVQRRSVMRVTSAFRTISEGAALVLASRPPIDLMIRERREIYEACCENKERKKEEKKLARQRLMERWQTRWDADTSGRWTHRLIPSVKEWYDRAHGQMNYHLTQALSGHGCFNQYLERFKKTESAACLLCGHTLDDAKHAIFECPETEVERLRLCEALGEELRVESLVPAMLKDERSWTAVSAYIKDIIERKREAEQQENRRVNRAREAQPLNP